MKEHEQQLQAEVCVQLCNAYSFYKVNAVRRGEKET